MTSPYYCFKFFILSARKPRHHPRLLLVHYSHGEIWIYSEKDVTNYIVQCMNQQNIQEDLLLRWLRTVGEELF